MKTIYPDYYENFKCIAEKCNHSCCIGWEIDIDEESLELYKSAKGDFGKRLRENISFEGTPHFKLKENDRCPFLNGKNLCDIYTELGEHRLCQICSDHPRFYNQLPDRIEAGLGLCCEEAARLIITKKEPAVLIGEYEGEDLIITLRDKALSIISDNKKPIKNRLENLMALFGIKYTPFDISTWVSIFEKLERLDQSWSNLLSLLKEKGNEAHTKGFDALMGNRQHEYSQFLHYLIYRHLAKAEFIEDAALYAAFAVLSYNLVHTLGAVIFTEKGDFTVDNQIELVRLFSSEIEYSDENLDIILSELENEIFGY